MPDLKLNNGLVRVERLHTSKRGHVYKRRRIVRMEVKSPVWFKRAMMRMRWFAS